MGVDRGFWIMLIAATTISLWMWAGIIWSVRSLFGV